MPEEGREVHQGEGAAGVAAHGPEGDRRLSLLLPLVQRRAPSTLGPGALLLHARADRDRHHHAAVHLRHAGRHPVQGLEAGRGRRGREETRQEVILVFSAMK